MFRGRFLGAILALLLIIGLFGLAGSSIYRAGWTQGYFVGKASDGATVVGPDEGVPSEAAPNASAPYYGPGRAFGSSPFLGFFGAIFKFFLFFMVLGLIFKLFFGLIFWRKRGRWGKHWYPNHGWGHNHGCHHGQQQPPWYDEGVGDEPVMKA